VATAPVTPVPAVVVAVCLSLHSSLFFLHTPTHSNRDYWRVPSFVIDHIIFSRFDITF
jgi:hypothetical protein